MASQKVHAKMPAASKREAAARKAEGGEAADAKAAQRAADVKARAEAMADALAEQQQQQQQQQQQLSQPHW